MTEETGRRDEEAVAADRAGAEAPGGVAGGAGTSDGTGAERRGGGDDPGGGSAPSHEPGSRSEADADVEALRDELAALNDRHLRLAAEFDNYRKRNERDRQMTATRLQADLVAALLDVLDDLERVAASDVTGSAESVVEGVRLVEKKFLGVLEGAGLEPVQAEGLPFNPETMEALMAVPTDDPEEDHLVADVFQRGYRFRDSLLRPARVRVLQYEEPSDGVD